MIQHATNPDLIRRRAYELWLNRGRPVGSPDSDWMNAEQELIAAAVQSEALPECSTARASSPARDAAPAPKIPKPRRSRSIVTRSAASPAAQLLGALAQPASESAPESAPRPKAGPPAPVSRRAPQKRSA